MVIPVFSDEPMPLRTTKSIFLAGPSPRTLDQTDWRKKALAILDELGYDGHAFVPAPRAFFYGEAALSKDGYDGQIDWEIAGRRRADAVAFWVDRRVSEGFPGFTTNVEFGEDVHSKRTFYGRPEDSERNKYLDGVCMRAGIKIHSDLKNLLEEIVTHIGEGSERVGGESDVPLVAWRFEPVRNWLDSLKAAGHSVERAETPVILKSYGRKPSVMALKASIAVKGEDRVKDNEFVIARADISSVAAYSKLPNGDFEIVLVKEFRTAVNNSEGFVYELVSGSSSDSSKSPMEAAIEELFEEAGIAAAEDRLEFVSSRQLFATLSSCKSHLFKIELSEDEMDSLKNASRTGGKLGLTELGEVVHPVVVKLSEISRLPVDYSTLGMIRETFEWKKHD